MCGESVDPFPVRLEDGGILKGQCFRTYAGGGGLRFLYGG